MALVTKNDVFVNLVQQANFFGHFANKYSYLIYHVLCVRLLLLSTLIFI